MKNIFKDLVDVNNYETLKNKYTELLEKHIEQQDVMKKDIFNFNKKIKKLNVRVSDLETKKKGV